MFSPIFPLLKQKDYKKSTVDPRSGAVSENFDEFLIKFGSDDKDNKDIYKQQVFQLKAAVRVFADMFKIFYLVYSIIVMSNEMSFSIYVVLEKSISVKIIIKKSACNILQLIFCREQQSVVYPKSNNIINGFALGKEEHVFD